MLKHLKLEGYKSVAKLDLELGPLNVLIGANGAGKSNILSVFGLLNQLTKDGALGNYVSRHGNASSLLHLGPKKTARMLFELTFETKAGRNIYRAVFTHGQPDALVFEEEKVAFEPDDSSQPAEWFFTAARNESRLADVVAQSGPSEPIERFIRDHLDRCRLYHFHDTSPEAKVRLTASLHDDRYLFADAGNLAPFLSMLRQNHLRHFREIVENVRMAFPPFGDLILEPSRSAPESILLRWRERASDYEFGPHQMSDGTLRFLCLATLLLQPFEHANAPKLIILDEPELGLHPYAIQLLASMLTRAASEVQIIISTQAASLVSALADPAAIVVVEREDASTTAHRLTAEEVEPWLDEYSLGDIWEKGILRGRPRP
jgi:predicted ATPase